MYIVSSRKEKADGAVGEAGAEEGRGASGLTTQALSMQVSHTGDE